MATIDKNTLQNASNLNLWFKIQTGDALSLTDIPEIIPLRWTYFRDNWSLLKTQIKNQANGTFDPDYLLATIDDLTDFIKKQQANTNDSNPFANNNVYFRFYPIFELIKLNNITTTNEERTLITNKKNTVSVYSKINFLNIKKSLREYRDSLADSVGLTDQDYNAIYDRAPLPEQITASILDLKLMSVIEKLLSTVDFILANLFAIDTALDPFALAKANADNNDIDIRQYKSGKLVKLNFREDLPSLAKRTLGDADKWINIAIANGLKDPYIDETGEQLYFLTNGSGNQINIASVDTYGVENINKFFINQVILIQSTVNPFPTQRKITGIKQIPLSNEIILTVSGDSNMGSYLLSENASIRIFKPNTANSSQYLLIPSEQEKANTREDEIPWFLTGKANDEKNTKIDIAVDSDGKLLKNSVGDVALSYGLDNAVQAIKAKILTELGANRRHPGFGLVNLVGTSNTQSTDIKATLVSSINTQIAADDRFDRVETLNVVKNTTAEAVVYDVTLVVKLAGSSTLLPITFTVNT